MKNTIESIFPSLHFSGAFLTPDLQLAFIVPMLTESEVLEKSVDEGNVFVHIEDSYTYVANGIIFFGGEPFQVYMTVRRAGSDGGVMASFEISRKIQRPRLFKGVGDELYLAGTMHSCDSIKAA